MPDFEANGIDVWSSLDKVGPDKPLGYLPILTAERESGLSVGEVASKYRRGGRDARVYDSTCTCIKGGALFVYDIESFQRAIGMFEVLISENGWPMSVDGVLTKIAANWFESNDPIMPLVRYLYNDTLGAQMDYEARVDDQYRKT